MKINIFKQHSLNILKLEYNIKSGTNDIIINGGGIMDIKKVYAKELIDFLYESPTAFHAVENVKNLLLENDFIELNDGDKWMLKNGGKYFSIKNNSAITAFVVGTKQPEETGFRIIGAHTDSPCFRIKPNPEIISENNYIKLNTEVYGGPILNTWFDRPLSIAGRITLKNKHILKPLIKIININKPILIIPNLAIHMNRNVNLGIDINKQVDTLPTIGLINDTFEKENYLLKIISKEIGISSDEILDFDLFLYEHTKGELIGYNEEFISAGRIDDLSMVHAGITALINVKDNESTRVMVCFDNEEIGSSTKQGADSNMLANILERIVLSFKGDREDFFRSLSQSFLISADGAHAVHPNKGEKSDPVNRPKINCGPVIKISANQKYTSDSESIAIFKGICNEANVAYQTFVNRSDEVGGSTIGPISSTHLDVKSVDIGSPMLAMHSIRELCGVEDHYSIKNVFEKFYEV